MSRSKKDLRKRRKVRIRKGLIGTSDCPRLTVFKSLKYLYAQVIDDSKGHTLVSASSLDIKAGGANLNAAKAVGELIAERAKAKKIDAVVFDRNGYLYHGVIKQLADAARESGLKF